MQVAVTPETQPLPPPAPSAAATAGGGGGSRGTLAWLHDAASRVTELRRHVLPYEGTLDFWVLLTITLLNVVAVVGGFLYAYDGTMLLSDADVASPTNPAPYRGGNLFRLEGDAQINLKLIATVFAMVESAPGVLFIWYAMFYRVAPWTLKLWVPLVIGTIAVLVTLVELRVFLSFFGEELFGLDVERIKCNGASLISGDGC